MMIESLAGAAVIAAMLALIIKQYRPEIAMAITVVTCLLLLLASLDGIAGLFGFVERIVSENAGSTENLKILFKCIGVAYLAQLAADACRDVGEGAIATKIELAGKVLILLLALPLFESLLALIAGVLRR